MADKLRELYVAYIEECLKDKPDDRNVERLQAAVLVGNQAATREALEDLRTAVREIKAQQGVSAGQECKYSTGMASQNIANFVRMRAKQEQNAMYISGALVCVASLWHARKGLWYLGRAKELGLAATFKAQGKPVNTWPSHVAKAEATPVQLRYVQAFIRNQSTEAALQFVAAVAWPLSWAGFAGYRMNTVLNMLQEMTQPPASRATRKS